MLSKLKWVAIYRAVVIDCGSRSLQSVRSSCSLSFSCTKDPHTLKQACVTLGESTFQLIHSVTCFWLKSPSFHPSICPWTYCTSSVMDLCFFLTKTAGLSFYFIVLHKCHYNQLLNVLHTVPHFLKHVWMLTPEKKTLKGLKVMCLVSCSVWLALLSLIMQSLM